MTYCRRRQKHKRIKWIIALTAAAIAFRCLAQEAAQTFDVLIAAETTVEEKTYVDVTVKGNEYLYQNNTIELAALTDELKKLGADITVRITDESASKNERN